MKVSNSRVFLVLSVMEKVGYILFKTTQFYPLFALIARILYLQYQPEQITKE